MSAQAPLLSGQGENPFNSGYGSVDFKNNSKDPATKRCITKKTKTLSTKLGTFEGVFLPTSLNVLSILMFLRFGFILGQMGILGTFLLLVISYTIDILTTLSISAISTNGTVKGGGAYYMISRSLGPEFGGAIGIIFFIGQILNSSLNVVGFIEPLLVNFGQKNGEILNILPVDYWYTVLYSTILLAICTCIALVGAGLVSKTAFYLFIILSLSTLSIPVSAIFVHSFHPFPDNPEIWYSGLNWKTFCENLWPKFTSGAAGSVLPKGEPESFRDLFGIFFPATAGIFAGASMSGDLKTPSKSIPLGTLRGLFVTFILYSLVIIFMGGSIPRELLYYDIKVIQTVSLHSVIIILGEFSTSLFSVIMGIVGAASMLSAIADDKIIPGLSTFAVGKKSEKEKKKAKNLAIFATWSIAQIFLFADINQIATFITMAFLMTFIVMNLACFLLRMGSAPNFRPSFRYFSSKTALSGVIASVAAMYIVDGLSASVIIVFLFVLIISIHYSTPPSKFGDISQLLIYHQVRKYLLRLKLQMSVKYWRPQILLLVDSPRSGRSLIKFCNHLKKGGLYILGHVVLMEDDTDIKNVNPVFTNTTFQELKKQNQAWVKLRDVLNVKAFVQIALGPTLPWGVRNVYLGSGIGGMRPNITVIGFYDFNKHGISLPMFDTLPTDDLRKERKVSINQWVQIIEDLVILQATVAVAANFSQMEVPLLYPKKRFWDKRKVVETANPKKYIDLYPIQMSSVDTLENGKSVVSTNFDTYTLILQLGAILKTVPEWKHSGYILRVIVFVENESEIADEQQRLDNLLGTLRIDAESKVACLSDGSLSSYNILVKGYSKNASNQEVFKKVDDLINNDQWWKSLCNSRSALKELEKAQKAKRVVKRSATRFEPLDFGTTQKKPLSFNNKRRNTISGLYDQGISLSLNINSQGAQYFNNNMQSSDSESDTEWDSENDRLFVEEPSPAPSIDSNRVNLNSKTAIKYSNKDSLRRPLHNVLNNPDQGSIRSLKTSLRPNFSSIKVPQTKVAQDDAESDDDNNPKIEFVNDDKDSDEAEDDKVNLDLPDNKSMLTNTSKYAVSEDPLSRSSSGTVTPRRPKIPNRRSTALFTNGDEILQKIKTPQLSSKEGDSQIPSISLNNSKADSLATEKNEEQDNTISQRQLQEELNSLSFNDLPAKGQHIILNEFIKKYSNLQDTGVIFSTLPTPELGTHNNDDDAFEYTNNLAIWLEDLPPTLLVNSQTITVTTAL